MLVKNCNHYDQLTLNIQTFSLELICGREDVNINLTSGKDFTSLLIAVVRTSKKKFTEYARLQLRKIEIYFRRSYIKV